MVSPKIPFTLLHTGVGVSMKSSLVLVIEAEAPLSTNNGKESESK